MAEAHPTWHFEIGDTWAMMFACQNTDGTPMVIDPAVQLIWRLADRFKETTLFALARDTGGITIANVDLGQIIVTLAPEQSSILTPGRYFDELTAIKGGTFTMAEGMIIAKQKLPAVAGVLLP